MPRFHFDLNDRSQEPDTLGIVLADRSTAEREAVRFLGEVLTIEPGRLKAGTLRVEVTDEHRAPLFAVRAVAESLSSPLPMSEL